MNIDSHISKIRKPGFRPNVCVKYGKLYAFSEVRAIVVRGWPEMSAWTRTYLKPQWSRLRPQIDFREEIIDATRSRHITRPNRFPAWIMRDEEPLETQNDAKPGTSESNKFREAFEKEKQLVRDYFGNVPLDVREAIQPFENRHWHLHVLAARCRGSLDLLTSNPALAYGLASCWAFSLIPSRYAVREMRRLIDSKRRKICGALGFPESESSVSILAKIPASLCCIPWLLTMRDLLEDPAWRKPLLHLPALNPTAFLFLGNVVLRCRTTPRLLHELCNEPISIFEKAVDSLRTLKDLGEPWPAQLHSVREIMRLATDLDLPKSHVRRIRFPKPPIPGTETIVPLENWLSLFEEGRKLHNCAVSHGGNVAFGDTYFYRVLKPERAMLSIVPDENGKWKIDQLLRARNEPVSEATYKAVIEWLSRNHYRQ